MFKIVRLFANNCCYGGCFHAVVQLMAQRYGRNNFVFSCLPYVECLHDDCHVLEALALLPAYLKRMIITEPTIMMAEPISFLRMPCSLKKRYPSKTLTMVES